MFSLMFPFAFPHRLVASVLLAIGHHEEANRFLTSIMDLEFWESWQKLLLTHTFWQAWRTTFD
jgi:hypothetical protein